jgi:signal transduction histidine kinase/ligand-binding sensor domain-containing protein/ActR/RegA family two-component response regulator
MRSWGLFVCLLCLIQTVPVRALPETPQFRAVGVAEGLPSSSITGLALDRDGYLWISTRDGLARYDGIGYKVYQFAPGDSAALPGNFVQTVFVDAGNRVWVGIEGQGLSVLDAGRRGFRHFNTHTRPLMLSDDVFAIIGTPDGCLWFGTFGGGLYRLDRQERLTRFMPSADKPRSLPDENVLSLTVDDRGQLWVGTTSGVARWTGKDFERVPGEQLSDPVVLSLSPDKDGSLWIGTKKGLDHRLVDGRIDNPGWTAQLPSPRVNSVLRDRDGTRWISTQHGLVRERDGVVDGLKDEVAGNRAIQAGLEDAEGGLWFATEASGLLRLPPGWRHFANFGSGPGPGELTTVPVLGSALGHDGRLWLVGAGGMVDRLDPLSGRIEHVFGQTTILPARIWSVIERSDGSVWFGHAMGLSRFEPGTGAWQHWRIGEGDQPLLPGPVQLFTETDDGLLWLASYGGGIQARDRAGRIVHSFVPGDGHGVDSPEQEQMAIGPDNRLWLAGPKGLRRWNGSERRFERIAGAPDDHVYGFAFVPPDTLWLHRMGALEAYRWDGAALARFISVGADAGLPSVESGGLLVDRSGAVWLTTTRGLLRYDPVGERLRRFGERDGLLSQEFQMRPPLMLPDGLGLASTNEGLVLFDPGRIQVGSQLPRLTLDTITLRREEDLVSLPTHGEPLLMQPEDRDLHVSARLLSFADPGAHRYRFFLHGYDADWVSVGASGERDFSRLEPGHYRMEVAAANADGLWSTPRGFRLEVLAPWWQRSWALALWVAASLLLLVLAAQVYRYRLRARHADNLREQQRRMSDQGSEAKTRFLATLGHEIRTPMTGVLGMAELLQTGSLEPKQRSRVLAIQHAGEHLLRLVNDALDLARIEAGKLGLDDAPFDLHQLLDEVASLLQALAVAKHLQFTLQRAPGTPRALRGDAGRVRQILLNLGSNAIKFTETGEVALRSAATPNGLLLEISDTGPGLNADQLARLFQRFEQAEGPRTAQRYGGSGLGLAICRELAAAMNGRIDVQSQPGQGSTFRVMLPLAAAGIDELARPNRRAPRKADGLRILVVEDDPTVAEVVTGLLESLGHEPVHSAQGLSALTELSASRFDLAFLDLDLPGIDGFELARIIRSQGHTLVLIALTARADPQAEPLALAAGMHGFLRKPVTSQLLQDKIESVLAALRGPPTGEQPRL